MSSQHLLANEDLLVVVPAITGKPTVTVMILYSNKTNQMDGNRGIGSLT